MENIKLNAYGEAKFKKETKNGFSGLQAFGTITDLDTVNVEFTDNDGFIHIVRQTDFKFQPKAPDFSPEATEARKAINEAPEPPTRKTK